MRGVDILLTAVRLLGLLTLLSLVVLSLVWLERKVLARFQRRMGPMRVGTHGLLQPVADALKLIVKEDVTPAWADRLLFWAAPLMVFAPSFMVWVTIPFARGVVVRNLDMGLFYIVAVSVVSIVGLVMAGWGSANKYAVLGGLRSAAQLVSYEIPIIMAVVGVAMVAQSTNLVTIVEAQRSLPYAVLQPLGVVVFVLAGVAEVGRTPFDIYLAESEVVGGPFVEYSGAHWAVFFLAEYINTFVVGVLVALLFLGGWSFPLVPNLPALGFLWVLVKTYLVVIGIFWLRGTFPRLRVDQLMSLGWKLLVPLSFVNIVMTGFYQFYHWPFWSLTLMSALVVGLVGYAAYRQQTRPAIATAAQLLERARAYRRQEAPHAG